MDSTFHDSNRVQNELMTMLEELKTAEEALTAVYDERANALVRVTWVRSFAQTRMKSNFQNYIPTIFV